MFRFRRRARESNVRKHLFKGQRILVTGVTLYLKECENLLMIGAITARGVS